MVLTESQESSSIIETCQLVDKREIEELQLYALSFHSVAEGPPDQGAVNLRFRQVILRTLMKRPDCQVLVVANGQHDKRRLLGCAVHPSHGFQSLSIRQPKVQQDRIGTAV